MIIKVIRRSLGYTIVALNALCPPKKIKRSQEAQARIDDDVKQLSLYQFYLCPFCVRVRRAMTRLHLPIVCYNANEDKQHESDLIAGGGKRKVPCLRIEEDNRVTWMYESLDIVAYLDKRFGY